MLAGKAREMGLGGLSKVSLADARKKVGALRALLADKIDPIARREAEDGAKKIEAARSISFDDCATAYVKAHEAGWHNAKHRQQRKNTLATYVSPAIGSLPVADVDVGMVMKVLEPLWTVKPETAGRVRGRIEAVLDWAKVRGFRQGENPALARASVEPAARSVEGAGREASRRTAILGARVFHERASSQSWLGRGGPRVP